MPTSRGCCCDEVLEKRWWCPPPPPPTVAFPESKDSVTTVLCFRWRGGTMRELELAGFHLLSHVGGEVLGKSE